MVRKPIKDKFKTNAILCQKYIHTIRTRLNIRRNIARFITTRTPAQTGNASSPSTVSQGTGARNTVWNATKLTRVFAGMPKTYGLLAFGVPPQGRKYALQAVNLQDFGLE